MQFSCRGMSFLGVAWSYGEEAKSGWGELDGMMRLEEETDHLKTFLPGPPHWLKVGNRVAGRVEVLHGKLLCGGEAPAPWEYTGRRQSSGVDQGAASSTRPQMRGNINTSSALWASKTSAFDSPESGERMSEPLDTACVFLVVLPVRLEANVTII